MSSEQNIVIITPRVFARCVCCDVPLVVRGLLLEAQATRAVRQSGRIVVSSFSTGCDHPQHSSSNGHDLVTPRVGPANDQ